jgi:hypothetical protein
MNEAERSSQAERLLAAADRIRVDAATAEVLRAFAVAGIQSVLLKGPALASWLYSAEDPRAYMDCDLWIRPPDMSGAEAALTRLGFVKHLDETGLPDWWLEHGSDWTRAADGVVIDLHRTLIGLRASPADAWQVLAEGLDTVLVAGQPAFIFRRPAQAMYLTLHAAGHGEQWHKALVHVERVLAHADDPLWREAADLAERLGAGESFAAGLRLIPEGAALAQRLGLGSTQSVAVALRASTPPPIALGFEQLAGAGSARRRTSILVRKLVPPPGFIRHWWPPAARNPAMLALGYLYRPLWLVRNAPRGWRAWQEARARVRSRGG